MRIQADNINFNAKLRTASVLEAATGKFIENSGVEGMKEVFLAFRDKKMKAAGNRGYYHNAIAIGEKIKDKYPEIKIAADAITTILEKEPKITKNDLRAKVQPYIDEIGTEIDIEV